MEAVPVSARPSARIPLAALARELNRPPPTLVGWAKRICPACFDVRGQSFDWEGADIIRKKSGESRRIQRSHGYYAQGTDQKSTHSLVEGTVVLSEQAQAIAEFLGKTHKEFLDYCISQTVESIRAKLKL